MKINRQAALIVLALLMIAGGLAAQGEGRVQRVTVEGTSFIDAGNVQLARNLAMDDAKRKAIEAGAGVYVRSESEIDQFGNLFENFVSRSQGFIGKMEILKEGQRGNDYFISINADVFLDIVLENLSELDILDDHKVMLFVDERTSGTPFSAATLETELMNQLISNFIIVDRQQMDAVQAKNAVDQAIAGNLDAALALANQFGADTFIVGTAQSQQNTNMNDGMSVGGYFGTYDSIVQLKVINANTARVIFAKNFQVTGKPANSETMAASNAMILAGQAIGKEINVEVPKKWGAMSVDGYRYRITVRNASFATINNVTELLRSTGGFVRITGEQFNAGVVTFDLVHKQKALNIAGMIDGKTVGGQRFSVVGYTDSSLDLKVG